MIQLTPTQARVLEEIKVMIQRTGLSPTRSELARRIGISVVTVYEHLRGLQDRGAITVEPRKHRGIAIRTEARPIEPYDEALAQIGKVTRIGTGVLDFAFSLGFILRRRVSYDGYRLILLDHRRREIGKEPARVLRAIVELVQRNFEVTPSRRMVAKMLVRPWSSVARDMATLRDMGILTVKPRGRGLAPGPRWSGDRSVCALLSALDPDYHCDYRRPPEVMPPQKLSPPESPKPTGSTLPSSGRILGKRLSISRPPVSRPRRAP